MTSPVVGSARVEILGDLDEFTRQTIAQTDEAMGRMHSAVSEGLNSIGPAADESGKRAGADFTNGMREKLASGMHSADESVTNSMRAVSEKSAGEGRAAGEKFSAGLDEGLKAAAVAVEGQVAREGSEAEGLFARYGRAAGEKFNESAKEGAKGIGAGLLAGFGALGAGEIVKGSLEAADSLEKANIKIEHAFGESATSVEDWAKKTSTSLGLSQTDAENLAGTFDRILAPMNLGDKQAASMSEHFAALAQNIAAANGADPGKVDTAMIAGLRGRATALRQYGIDLSTTTMAEYLERKGLLQATVDQTKVASARTALRAATIAYKSTLKDTTATELQRQQALDKVKSAQDALTKATTGTFAPLTDAQKTQAAYGMILAQTRNQADAFAEHSDTWAEKQQILTAEWDNAKSTIGTKLMPILVALAGYFTRDVIPALEAVGHWVVQNRAWLEPLAIAVGAVVVAWKAWTIAEAAFNAVMDANPILLVVSAIAALAVGLVEAYKHVKWFRDFVNAAFAVVKAAALALWHGVEAAWHNVGKPIFDVIVAVIKVWWKAVKVEWGLLVDAWKITWALVQAAWRDVGHPIFTAIVDAVHLFVGAWRAQIAVIKAIWHGLWTAAATVWRDVIEPIFSAIMTGIHIVEHVWNTVTGAIANAWHALGDTIARIYNDTIGPIIRAVQDAWHFITGGGSTGTVKSPQQGGGYPLHAHGGVATGSFIAGDDGPELIDIGPRRANIMPSPGTRMLLGGAETHASGLSESDRALLRAVANRPVYVELGGSTLVKAKLSRVVADGDLINARRQGVNG